MGGGFVSIQKLTKIIVFTLLLTTQNKRSDERKCVELLGMERGEIINAAIHILPRHLQVSGSRQELHMYSSPLRVGVIHMHMQFGQESHSLDWGTAW